MREDILTARLDKKKRLDEVCGSAYPAGVHRTHTNRDVLDHFDALAAAASPVVLVGRVRSLRVMGKIAFAHIEDGTAKIQVFVAQDKLPEGSFKLFCEVVELGDFLEGEGTLFLTKQGEKTIALSRWSFLGKALRPIPTEYYGLSDEEERLRRRYLDLLTHPETRELFEKKAVFWQTIRQFLSQRRFLEVATPVLEHIPGGAEAEPFTTHHNALEEDFYLRISLELALKRLLVGGYERVFEIGRVFRNEGIDREHLQEFDHMECYAAYMDFDAGCAMVEELYRDIVRAVAGPRLATVHDGETLDWSKPFPRVDYFERFLAETGIDLSHDVTVEELRAAADRLGIVSDPQAGKGRLIDTLYKKTVRQKLIQPCLLVGHPIEVSPLAKSDPTNPRKVLRMQPVAGRSELGNGFAELNDPLEQRRRFEEQMQLRAAGDREAQMLDEDFLEALEYGLPPAFGFGMSERFFAILMDKSVRETFLFPPMKEKSE
jgi:lysyl-tRNA synthetase, class II